MKHAARGASVAAIRLFGVTLMGSPDPVHGRCRSRTIDVDDGPEKVTNLHIGTRDQEPTRPVYLPGYISWEHQVGHHDPGEV
jgi:hypothetical protein